MMLKQIFDISTGFRFSKMQWVSVPFIPVAVLVLNLLVWTKSFNRDHRLPGIKSEVVGIKGGITDDKGYVIFVITHQQTEQ